MPSYNTRHLTLNDTKEFVVVVGMFTAMTNQHATAVPEVFEYPGPTKTPEFVRDMVTDHNNAVFVAIVGSEVVATAQVGIITVKDKPGWRPRRFGYLDRLYVLADFRQQGIGRGLVQSCESWLRSRGIDMIELNTWQFNKDAQVLFKSLGYEVKNINMWRRF